MIHKKTTAGRIPAGELPALKRWALPRVDSGHVVTSPFQGKAPGAARASEVEELDLSQLTVEALQKLRDDARTEGLEQGVNEGRSKGEREGLSLGRDAGYKAAFEQAQGEIDALKARLAGMASQLCEPLQQQHDELEEALLNLVQEVSRAVVGRELQTRPELIADTLKRALEALPHEGELSFSVHPDDEALLLELREREGDAWVVRTDPAMSRGGVTVRGAHSYLDYRVEGRFAAVVAQLQQDAAEQAAVQDNDALDP